MEATTVLKKALRRLQAKNYREESVNDSASDENNENDKPERPMKRLPVYRQKNVFEEKSNTNDPFEFVVESPKKKRNEGSVDSDCNPYDRSMHQILKSIEQNFAKKEKLVKKLRNIKKLNISVEESRRRMLKNKVKGGLTDKISAPNSHTNTKLSKPASLKEPSSRPIHQPVNRAKLGLFKQTTNQDTLKLLTKEIQRVCRNISKESIRQSIPIEDKADERTRLVGFENDSVQDKSPLIVSRVPDQSNTKLPTEKTADKTNPQSVDNSHSDDEVDGCDRFFGFNDDSDSGDSVDDTLPKVQGQDVMQPPAQIVSNEKREIFKELPTQNNTMQPKTNESSRYFGFDDDDKGGSEISMVLPSNSKIKTSTKQALNQIQPFAQDSERFTLLTSTPLPKAQKSKSKQSKQKNKENINIISNIIISPSRKSRHTLLPPQTPNSKPPPANNSTIELVVPPAPISKPPPANNSTIELVVPPAPISKPPPANNSTIKLVVPPAPTVKSPLNDTSIESLKSAQFSETAGLLSFIPKTAASASRPIENGFLGFTPQKPANAVPNTSAKTPKQVSGPWRGDCLSVRRNPHFLNMKDTSLPSYNQDMVLEPQLVEKPTAPQPTKVPDEDKTLQTSILDFVNTSGDHLASTPTKSYQKSTFFDEGDFSPIKTRNANVQAAKCKKNEVQKLQSRKNVSGKQQANASPGKSHEQSKSKLGLENYFGFDSLNNSKEQGVRITRSKVAAASKSDKNESALPMRVPIKQRKKIHKKAVEELVDKAEPPQNIEEAEKNLKDELVVEPLDSEAPIVGLFEDFQDVRQQAERVYKRKRTKRMRLMSVDSDAAEEEKPKTKKKDVFTPAEEEEFNKWAAAFNAMCEEIEKHDLEKD